MCINGILMTCMLMSPVDAGLLAILCVDYSCPCTALPITLPTFDVPAARELCIPPIYHC